MRLGKTRFECKYLAIQAYSNDKHWSINWMCKTLGVSHAAYYKWFHREVPEQELEDHRKYQRTERGIFKSSHTPYCATYGKVQSHPCTGRSELRLYARTAKGGKTSISAV